MSEGSEHRLSLPDRLVSDAWRGGCAEASWLRRRLSDVAHLDCAFAVSLSNRTGSAIHDPERPLSAFVHEEATRSRFEWCDPIVGNAKATRPRAITGRQEVSDEFTAPE